MRDVLFSVVLFIAGVAAGTWGATPEPMPMVESPLDAVEVRRPVYVPIAELRVVTLEREPIPQPTECQVMRWIDE